MDGKGNVSPNYLEGDETMRRRTVTAVTESGENIRISLGEPTWTGEEKAGTGISLTGLWIGRQRVVAEFDSIWESSRHPGQCVGTYYEVVTDPNDIIRLCNIADIEPPEFIPVEDV
jgi:hypothetical protein